jgi:GNAT superfamily N-acetyltransferase
MTIDASSDPDWILAALDRAVSANPISATVLGSIRTHVASHSEPGAWAARSDDSLAARSSASVPVVVSGAWPDPALSELAAALRELPGLVGISGPAPLAERVAAGVGRPARGLEPRRLYRLDELTEPSVPGGPRAAQRPDAELLQRWYEAFHLELDGEIADGVALGVEQALTNGRGWLWLDGAEPVAMAIRRAPEGGSARIGPVYTPPEQRGHGYAAAVTAAATRDILELRAVPVLFTDLNNPLTNRLYPRLGYYPVEDQLQVRF